MNSRQRRKSLRYWRHRVCLNDSIDYQELMAARKWCQTTYGEKNYGNTWSNFHGYIEFYFRHDRDAVMFALHWA